VNIRFWRGAELTDPTDLLEGDGDRMRRIKLIRRADIPQPAIKHIVKVATKLNQALGDPTQRKKEPRFLKRLAGWAWPIVGRPSPPGELRACLS
jgi:hypothetical protein